MLTRHSGTSATALQSSDSRTIVNVYYSESHLKATPRSRLNGGGLYMMECFYKLHSHGLTTQCAFRSDASKTGLPLMKGRFRNNGFFQVSIK